MLLHYPRFLRRLGFGVHSPFAYRFIKEVIGEKCAYYDYKAIPAKQWLLYRLIVLLQPIEIKYYDKEYDNLVSSLCNKRYKPAIWTQMNQTHLLIATSHDSYQEFLDQGWVTYLTCTNDSFNEMIINPIDCLSFFLKSEKVVLFFPWAHLPNQKIII